MGAMKRGRAMKKGAATYRGAPDRRRLLQSDA